MNIAFTKILKINERLWEFNFRKLPGLYPSYHVDLTSEKGSRIMFSIYRSAEGVWRTTSHKLPLWIASAESLIGETIEEAEKEIVS